MIHFFSVALALFSLTSAMRAGEEQIRVIPVNPTPESNSVVLAVALPHQGAVLRANPVWIQFRIDGYALGAASQFARAAEVSDSKRGQTIHVVIDHRPYIPIFEPAIDPFDEEGYFYDTSYKFELPFSLKEGIHTIRMFAARSFGESLKGENAFQALSFSIGSANGKAPLDLSQPYLTYNEPSNEVELFENKPLLLDFYLCNCELSPDGYKVRLLIDGKVKRTLTSWQPYYIYGLKRGAHSIRLQLLDPTGKAAPGLSNDVERTIHVKA